ncbi:MAG: nuclear transport factor 2 family protein [Bacteroidetes bacterium]|nr:nuclear transport factor 2 family protein [Bacteroidota bacterium]
MGNKLNMDTLQLANNWLDAFNTKNINALLSLYDINAQHYSPKLKIAKPQTNGFISGHDELREWWQGAFERLPQLYYENKNIVCNNEFVFIEYLRQAPGEADLMVGEVLEIKNGKIIFSRVYHS